MHIIARCPRCGYRWWLDATAADRRMRCRKCFRPLRIPDLTEIPEAGKATEAARVALLALSGSLDAAHVGPEYFAVLPLMSFGEAFVNGMVMAMMGGCWYPIELFPATMQNAVKIFPTTWAMQGFLDGLQKDVVGMISQTKKEYSEDCKK